jgi:hypothetical protein
LLTTLKGSVLEKLEVAGKNTKAARRNGGPEVFLAAKTQALDELLVLVGLHGFEVVEELATLVDHLHQSAPRGVIALMGGEMLTEAIDAFGKQRDLNFG